VPSAADEGVPNADVINYWGIASAGGHAAGRGCGLNSEVNRVLAQPGQGAPERGAPSCSPLSQNWER
jgi:hypothetical protein